jgi:hypothetical protein
VVRTSCTVVQESCSSLMLGAVMACTDLVLADYAEKRNGLALLFRLTVKARERGLKCW